MNSVFKLEDVLLNATDVSPRSQIAVRLATCVAEIEHLRPTWVAWQGHPNSDIDYFLAHLEANKTDRPYVMSVYRSGTLDCLLVGKLQSAPTPISAIHLPLPAARVLYFVTEGFLGNRSVENAELLVDQILEQMRQGKADLAEFDGLREDSPLYSVIRRIPSLLCRDHFPVARTHHWVLLPSSFEEYFRGLPSKERANVRTHQKLLVKSFPDKVYVRRFKQTEVDEMLRDVEAIAAKSYQRTLGVGFEPSDSQQLRVDAQKSSLWAYILYLDNEPCAFLIATQYKSTLYGRSIGYDPKYSRYSPGQYLLMRFIEDCFHSFEDRQIFAIDPGPGGQHYKRSFTNQMTVDRTIAIYAPTVKGLSINFVRTAMLLGSRGSKAFLERIGIGEKAWRTWKSWRRRSVSRAG